MVENEAVVVVTLVFFSFTADPGIVSRPEHCERYHVHRSVNLSVFPE